MKIRIVNSLFIALLGGSAVLAPSALAQYNALIHQATLNNPQPDLEDHFGKSVAISGTLMVVGARDDNYGAMDAGSAYVYDLAGAAPNVPVATLRNPSPETGDYFGKSASISGTRVVVGAYQDDTGATNAGSAYIYDLASPTPTLPVLRLNNPNPEQHDFFGWSVAISGTRVVVGAYQAGGYDITGMAFVYDLASPTPAVPVVRLSNPSRFLRDLFGWSVAISGTRVVVGAHFNDTGAARAGSAYVYDLTSPTPAVPSLKLTNPSPAVDDFFGISVAISGTRVVIGAVRDDTRATNAGSAYVYDLATATPTLPLATLTSPNPAIDDGFGFSVAISGTRAVVGAYLADNSAATTNSGRAYLYDLASATPTLPVATLNNPSPEVEDNFGYVVAIDGATVVAGSPNDSATGWHSGAAYIFAPVRPTLHIVRAAPGFATISWAPSDLPGLMLQYTDSLSSTNWTTAPSGALNPVTVPVTSAPRFYRLVEP